MPGAASRQVLHNRGLLDSALQQKGFLTDGTCMQGMRVPWSGCPQCMSAESIAAGRYRTMSNSNMTAYITYMLVHRVCTVVATRPLSL